MLMYENATEFMANLGHVRKWQRVAQAIDGVSRYRDDVAYSLGDSLTFWRNDNRSLHTDMFVGHRRYHTVLYAIQGDMTVRIADKSALTPVEPYRDTTDRELFDGEGISVTIPEGGLLIAEMHEAVRVEGDDQGAGMVLHVTREGYTFPNK